MDAYYDMEHDYDTVMERYKERGQVLADIRKQREGRMRPYFDLFHGVPTKRSQLPEESLEATEVLIKAGKFLEQKLIEGDSLIYLNETRTHSQG